MNPPEPSIFFPLAKNEESLAVTRARSLQQGGVGTRRPQSTDAGVPADYRHGVKSDTSHTAAEMLSPQPKSFVQELLDARQDALYASSTKPLGATARLKGIECPDICFGVKTVFDGTAAECLKSPADATAREPGQQTRRHYAAFDDTKRFGNPTPHDDGGGNIARTLHWVSVSEDEKATRVRSKIDEDFHAQRDHPLGRSPGVRAEQPFVPAKPVVPGNSESAAAVMYMRGKEPLDLDGRQSVVATVRHKLKRAGFEKFGELEAAFRAHDATGCGCVERRRIPAICRLFNLPIDEPLLDEMMTTCEQDGAISYPYFISLLDYNRLAGTPPPAPKSLQPIRPGGVPTIRADKAPPRLRRVCDTTNYGDEGDASGLLNPSTFAQHGVHARDFLCPRSQAEIRTLFANLGVELSDEKFSGLWDSAARHHPLGEVNVESFRYVLESS